jgi:AN1-type zinc finger and ubiquitin domain-containing protein 1
MTDNTIGYPGGVPPPFVPGTPGSWTWRSLTRPQEPTLSLEERLQRVEDNARHRLRMAELRDKMHISQHKKQARQARTTRLPPIPSATTVAASERRAPSGRLRPAYPDVTATAAKPLASASGQAVRLEPRPPPPGSAHRHGRGGSGRLGSACRMAQAAQPSTLRRQGSPLGGTVLPPLLVPRPPSCGRTGPRRLPRPPQAAPATQSGPQPTTPSDLLHARPATPKPSRRTHPHRPRCLNCKRKLQLATRFDCRCGGQFCSLCRHPEEHDCTFDYKREGEPSAPSKWRPTAFFSLPPCSAGGPAAGRQLLLKAMPKVVPTRLPKL